MGNIGDPISPSVPSVGAIGPTYASNINAILTEVISRLSSKVPLSSIGFNSTLNVSGSDIVGVNNLVFTNQSVAPTGSPFGRWAAFNGDIYWVGPSGSIQITSGGALNSAALGGITGDYGGASPAQLRYDSLNTRYDHYANFSTGAWAYTRALGMDITGGLTSTARARIQWGGAVNIAFTLPATLPAGNAFLTLDNTGAITAATDATPATNSNIILSGSGTYKHGVKTISRSYTGYSAVPPAANAFGQAGYESSDVVASLASTVIGYVIDVSSGNNSVYFRLPELPTHARIVDVFITFDSAANRNNCSAELRRTSVSDPASRTTSLVASLGPSGVARMSATGVNATYGFGDTFYVHVTNSSASTPAILVNSIINYDVP